MKSIQLAVKPTSNLSFIPLDVNEKTRKISLPAKRNLKKISDLVKAGFKKSPKVIVPYLTLSAAATKVSDKGFLNAINCRNMFPDGPNIDFVPQDSFGGKVEVWMKNVVQGDSFTVQFRVVCGYAGNWKISSSETAQYQTPITPVSQSIDFFIPPVTKDYGLVLISLEPLFTNYGSWVFHDVIFQKISF